MDYKKKNFRKLYEDLVKSEWFKKAYHDKSLGDCPFNIPELTESEDERVRKTLLEYIDSVSDNWVMNGFTKRDFLAWLEKQEADTNHNRMAPIYSNRDSFESALDKAWKFYNDSGSSTVDGCEENAIELAFAKGFREGFLAEKQKEQKHWQEQVGDAIQENCREIATKYEQKPADWSEEDDEYLNEIIEWVENLIDDEDPGDMTYEEHKDFYTKRIEWLKSLKYRCMPQPNQELGEEDETAFGDLMWCIERARRSAKNKNDMGNIWFAENWLKKKLKSLRPQPHWKPSEEQMQYLLAVINDPNNAGAESCHLTLESLYNDLKKLM